MVYLKLLLCLQQNYYLDTLLKTKSFFFLNRLFKQKIIFELGSGVGLTGFIISQFAKTVYLTDYQPVVLDLLN